MNTWRVTMASLILALAATPALASISFTVKGTLVYDDQREDGRFSWHGGSETDGTTNYIGQHRGRVLIYDDDTYSGDDYIC
ncbi:MAG: hypothetical protein HYV63_28250, partial [Candidatus Schekmanbacteria bacterium]|nr:hypothetical protein [Candidatus Schekmanbacteria bacterium]MBI2570914.1 hypothetical protein [Candidatus Schekmanbacteria bacterium]